MRRKPRGRWRSAHALCALGEGLGFEEALCKARLEGVLLGLRNVLALQQPVQGLHVRYLIPREEALGRDSRIKGPKIPDQSGTLSQRSPQLEIHLLLEQTLVQGPLV